MHATTELNDLQIDAADVKRLLEQGQQRYWKQLHAGLLQELLDSFAEWPAPPAEPEPGCSEDGLRAQWLVSFLAYETGRQQEKIAGLRSQYDDYSKRYAKALNEEEKREYILAYAQTLGASKRQLRRDRRAFNRWFGHDAMGDRYHRRHLETERYLVFVLQCLGRMAAGALAGDGALLGYRHLWQRLAIEPVIKPLLSYPGDKRVAAGAFQALALALRALPPELRQPCISEAVARFIYHACLTSRQSVWVQCEALQLLQQSAPDHLRTVLDRRLRHPQGGDDLFVRRKAVQIIGEQLARQPDLLELLPLVRDDPSPAVRQRLPAALQAAPMAALQAYLTASLRDSVAQVRAATLLSFPALLERGDGFAVVMPLLAHSLETETDDFALRVAMHVCRLTLEVLQATGNQQYSGDCLAALLPRLESLHTTAASLAVRRWAAQTREWLLLHGDAAARQRLQALRAYLETIPPGKSKRLPKHLRALDDTQLARTLSVVAQDDFGFDIESGLLGRFVARGHTFGFRVWRLIHEFRHPSPDKRQAFQHTRGRLFWGRLRVPSAILSELAETKVPGEPLFMSKEGGWRGYLPLVDEVISALALGGQASYFFHSEGVTCLQPPRKWLQRQHASWLLTWKFADYARLRNWQEGSQSSPRGYLQALAALGIEVGFQGHPSPFAAATEDSSVTRFFQLTPVFVNEQGWQQFKDYFVSLYENSLYELGVFAAAVTAFFVGRHVYLYQKLHHARRRLPLVLGGWGTRGKSGTERIKAALINALGFGIVSKTTGCEAMFLHAYPFGQLREMFLFRPYDKATIWEQHNLVCLADNLGCEVFLWECMGLTPSYIDILQRQWMRDDISTITNTYPDHEDLQGPAGINIPEVMTNFIPQRSTLLTTEEQMLPILRVAAAKKQTKLRPVGWLQAGLLAPDILSRFPYEEHPYNIALVLEMADELGVDYDFAVKEMADRVVADIGVLKAFPPAPWCSRRLEFINGMSANERFGSMSNWQRMGFDKLTLEDNPDVWITTVVNNRADRIARSRVFASILVKDVNFDRCVMIGNNLTGLMAYIKESWTEWIATMSLRSAAETPDAILLRLAKWFRVPHTQELVARRFELMLQAQGKNLDADAYLRELQQPDYIDRPELERDIPFYREILNFHRQDQNGLASYQKLRQQLDTAQGKVSDALEQQFKDTLWQWFEQKLVVVEDYYATGNEVIATIGHATPPGFHNRILGMQNIKGTGLDFVYRWQAWETCYNACRQLASPTPAESNQGLRTLAAFQEHGHLTEETVRSTVAKVREMPQAQNERYHAELELILSNLDQAMKKLAQGNSKSAEGSPWLRKINTAIEAFLDAGDAVRRRKKAERIYRDLIAEQISHDRAVLELQLLNKRQKGGWLKLFK